MNIFALNYLLHNLGRHPSSPSLLPRWRQSNNFWGAMMASDTAPSSPDERVLEVPSPAMSTFAALSVVGHCDAIIPARPSPVIALNRAIAVGSLDGPSTGLGELDRLLAYRRFALRHLAELPD